MVLGNGMDHQRFLAFGIAIGLLSGLIMALALFAFLNLVPADTLPLNESSAPDALEPLARDSYSATIDIVAVAAQNNAGVTNQAEVEVQPGKGRVLLSVNPFIEPDTQQSAETAKAVTERITGKNLDDFDLIYTIHSPAQLVGGPSAGAALTIATIAAVEHRPINQDVVMTGTIEPDGRIGPIGGVLEKAEAVALAGKKVFLVPKGHTQLGYYEPVRVVEQRGNITIQRVNYVAKRLDLIQYAQEQWGLQVKEVATIEEAAAEMLA